MKRSSNLGRSSRVDSLHLKVWLPKHRSKGQISRWGRGDSGEASEWWAVVGVEIRRVSRCGCRFRRHGVT